MLIVTIYTTFFTKLNKNKSSDIECGEENDSLPKIIDIPNSMTTTYAEPATSTDVNLKKT